MARAIVAAVLVGGRSVRMGTDKAWLPLGGRLLSEWPVCALRSVADEVYCVGGDGALAAALGVPHVPDEIPGAGPLGGLYSALKALGVDVVVVGCDMPLVKAGVLQRLIDLGLSADAVVPVNRGEYEPLLALYRQPCLGPVERALASGRRRVASFYEDVKLRVLAERDWRAVDPNGTSFLNVNTPQDLDMVRALLEDEQPWTHLAAKSNAW